MNRLRQGEKDGDLGFTLIELLVVIIIIGILAAIAIPSFLGQRQRAVEASMKSDLKVVAGRMETYFVDNFAYPGDLTPFVGDVVTSPNNTVTVEAVGAAVGTFCLKVVNASARDDMYYDSDRGGVLPLGTVCT